MEICDHSVDSVRFLRQWGRRSDPNQTLKIANGFESLLG